MLRKHFALFVAAAVLSLAAAGISQSSCPVADATRTYLEEIVPKLVRDTAWVTSNVHFQDRGFALSLFGTDKAMLGAMTLALKCRRPEEFVPTYETFDRGTTSLLQLACEARRNEVINLAVSSTSQHLLSAFHFLRYDATQYSGKVEYRPYPRVDWHTIKFANGKGNFFVSADVSQRLIFTPTGGTPVDLTHVGSLSGRVVNDEPIGATVYALFPSVISSQQPLVVNVDVDQNGVASGSTNASGGTLATISGTAFETAITWQGKCAPVGLQ